jgi:hypothetical protein
VRHARTAILIEIGDDVVTNPPSRSYAQEASDHPKVETDHRLFVGFTEHEHKLLLPVSVVLDYTDYRDSLAELRHLLEFLPLIAGVTCGCFRFIEKRKTELEETPQTNSTEPEP